MPAAEKLNASRLLVIGLGDAEALTTERLRRAAGIAARNLGNAASVAVAVSLLASGAVSGAGAAALNVILTTTKAFIDSSVVTSLATAVRLTSWRRAAPDRLFSAAAATKYCSARSLSTAGTPSTKS